jgi:hypothetical protein
VSGPPPADGLDVPAHAGGPGGGLLGCAWGGGDGIATGDHPATRRPANGPRPSRSLSAPAGGAVTATVQRPAARPARTACPARPAPAATGTAGSHDSSNEAVALGVNLPRVAALLVCAP